MEEIRTGLQGLSTPMLAVLAVFVIADFGLQIFAIVDIVRRPVDRIAGGNKLLWVLATLVVHPIGAIVYLVYGRTPAPAPDVAPQVPATERASDAADMLYGRREDAFSAAVPPTESAESSTVTDGESVLDDAQGDA